jgi:hypothetical protein
MKLIKKRKLDRAFELELEKINCRFSVCIFDLQTLFKDEQNPIEIVSPKKEI